MKDSNIDNEPPPRQLIKKEGDNKIRNGNFQNLIVSLKNEKNKERTIGPVADLENYVRPDWWRFIFNANYLKTDGDVVDDTSITKQEIDKFIEIASLKKESAILDLCCGQGRHTLELAGRGFQRVYGLDSSAYLIQRAKKQAKKESIFANFREGDARKIPYSSDSFDNVLILGNSFGYFESKEDDLRVLKGVLRALKPKGKILIDVSDGNFIKSNFKPRSWEWIDEDYLVCRERSLSKDRQKLISREVIIKVDEGIKADQFYAERLYTKETIKKLLESAGFSGIQFFGIINPDSKRNQDLGMMEQRIIVCAEANKNWTPKNYDSNQKMKNITVIMGDPTKSDKIKPDNVFDEDDMNTINQLKDGLRQIPGYNFRYLNRHNFLIENIKDLKDKTDLVFNLCDEGFGNEARKELHVPALLDMFDISYTGAGPQCLAFCYDKSLVRGVAKEMGIPVAKAFFINPGDTSFSLPPDMFFPVIVKPNMGDSSFGITQKSVANNVEELTNTILEIREKIGYDQSLLVEELLTGDDLTIGIIGNPPENYSILPITKEDYSTIPANLPQICGYEAKWMPESPYWNLKSVKANLPEETEKFIAECSLKLFKRLECKDYARFDWRLDSKGKPKFLEANPNPGWCWDGHLAKMARLVGLSYPDMLKAVILSAEKRINQTNGNGN
jgi:D-alanine-D-alanine ligase